MSQGLVDKRAVIIGAAGKDNMGQVIARRLAAEGARVLVAGRHRDALEALAAQIGGHASLCDITSEAELEALAESAARRLGGIDIAINATGWGFVKPFLDTTRDELTRMTALQFIGAFQFFQSMLRGMQDSGGGSLIQISSATATIMLDDHAAYMGTKAGIDHVVRCIANEFGQHGIRANSISPGLTDTPMTAGAKTIPGYWDLYAGRYPLKRTGTSEDIAAAVVFLASDECFMSGENLQVNGGLCLRGNPTREEKDAFLANLKQAR